MAPLNFLNLLAISSLAVLACSFGATPVSALATDRHYIRDTPALGHGAIAKRKRATSNDSKRCKQRPSSAQPSPTHKPSIKSSNKDKGDGKGDSKSDSKSDHTSTKHSSSSKPSSTPVSSPSGGGGKVGLAWANGPKVDIKPFINKNVGYIYTWSPNLYPNAKALGLRSMPMLWGDKQISDFKRLVKRGYADIVMGFNEPNEKLQSNMQPGHGATLWKQYIEPLKNEGYTTLVAPTTSSDPKGMTWVKNWFKACNGGCNPTHMGVHYYSTTASGFITYMKLWHSTFNKPIMATEWACQNYDGGPQCSKEQVESMMSESVKFMEETEWVTAYFAFGIMTQMQGVNALNQLMTSSGKPTSLGQQYLNP